MSSGNDTDQNNSVTTEQTCCGCRIQPKCANNSETALWPLKWLVVSGSSQGVARLESAQMRLGCRPTRNVAVKTTTDTCDPCCCNQQKRVAREFASMKAVAGQMILLNKYSFCALSHSLSNNTWLSLFYQKTPVLAGRRSSQPASDCDDMVRKSGHRQRNEHQTNVNIFFCEKLSLETPPTQKVKNQRVQDVQWTLMVGYLFAHKMVPRASISSLRKSKQNSAILTTVQNGLMHPGTSDVGAFRCKLLGHSGICACCGTDCARTRSASCVKAFWCEECQLDSGLLHAIGVCKSPTETRRGNDGRRKWVWSQMRPLHLMVQGAQTEAIAAPVVNDPMVGSDVDDSRVR